ncbi:hypothetical protein [Brevibacterium album]|uniref:hypothetical protein n=1 Tax=Brevibacterium album TaxID=417948 RepID=UPI00048B9EFB|nr:hypothetical protein [Brevibacterium album]
MGRAQARLTEDGRYIVVEGRRWRAADPAIPAPLKQELVGELMRARRLIGSGETSARTRVHDAKIALGERGRAWWKADEESRGIRAAAALNALLRARRGGPVGLSEVAQIVAGASWREHLRGLAELIETGVRAGRWTLSREGPMSADPEEMQIAAGPEFGAEAPNVAGSAHEA